MSGSYNKRAIHQTSRPSPRARIERVLSIEAVMDAARVVFQSGPAVGSTPTSTIVMAGKISRRTDDEAGIQSEDRTP